MFSFKKQFNSFKYAFRGFWYALTKEQSFQIHIIAALIVVFFMIYFDLKVWEYIALTLVITSVLVLELINTIFEKIVDILKPRVHPYAQTIKDMMAAAVLVASIGAIVVGLFIFVPYIFSS